MTTGAAQLRWDRGKREKVRRPDVDAFLDDIEAVCKNHGFSISHEDGQGAFVIEAFGPGSTEWLRNAMVET